MRQELLGAQFLRWFAPAELRIQSPENLKDLFSFLAVVPGASGTLNSTNRETMAILPW